MKTEALWISALVCKASWARGNSLADGTDNFPMENTEIVPAKLSVIYVLSVEIIIWVEQDG